MRQSSTLETNEIDTFPSTIPARVRVFENVGSDAGVRLVSNVPWDSTLTPQLAQTSMEKVQHQYQPLKNNDTIRILTLDPGQQGDPLLGTLKILPIDSVGRYEAVSYVWADPGPPNIAYEILIRDGADKEGLLVLRGGSIFAALHRIRLPDRPRRIWADQCCINQDDPVERCQQVQFMNRIYRDAAQVFVWLGVDTKKEAMLAFGVVHALDKVLNNIPADGTASGPDAVGLERHVKNNQKAIQDLTDRAWNTEGADSSNVDGLYKKSEPAHQQL
ncbi:hypothetical protein EG329_012718 [Mollisiaceae sp. DMI_Dod_QoI]|nr:hypothetical protein EG329_012718 [Helotiales sp. DMI_Dod_QoI]